MAYFPNGTSGDIFQSRFCGRCWHDRPEVMPTGGCRVWLTHVVHNYDQCESAELQSTLSMLIEGDDPTTATCHMFIPLTAVIDTAVPITPSEIAAEQRRLEAWNAGLPIIDTTAPAGAKGE